MAHEHGSSVKNIRIAFFLNLAFTVIELIGGVLTNSVAIMSDALHDLGDSFSLGLGWYLETISTRKRNAKFTYGYKRFSLLGALINTLILLVGSIFILTEAVPRLFDPQVPDAQGMFLLSIVGIAVNGYAVYKTSRGTGLNEKVISLHLLEDVLGWVAVMVVSIVMMFTYAPVLDPILSIAITMFILFNVFRNLRKTILVFLQAAPENLDIGTIEAMIKGEQSIKGVHDTHIWSLDGEKHIRTHVLIGKDTPEADIINIKCELKKKLDELGISHSTLEIEFEGETCEYCE